MFRLYLRKTESVNCHEATLDAAGVDDLKEINYDKFIILID